MLQNLPIRSKLVAILLVPLVALIAITSLRIGLNIADGRKADRAQRSMAIAVKVTELTDELQREQGRSVLFLASDRSEGERELADQRLATDRALAAFAGETERIDTADYNPGLGRRLAIVQARLEELETERRVVDEVPAVENRVVAAYKGMIDALLDVSGQVFGSSGDEELLRNVSAFAAVGQIKAAASQQRALLAGVFGRGRFAEGQFSALNSLITTQQVWQGLFNDYGSTEQQRILRTTVNGPPVSEVERLQLIALKGATVPSLGIPAQEWFDQSSAKVALLRQAELEVGANVVDLAGAKASAARRAALLSSIVLVSVMLLAVLVSLVIGRSMVAPLRRLRDAANEVATRRLPSVVDRLARAERVDVEAEAEPISTRSNDEIGEVADAFDSVHRAAVAIAAQQSTLRKSVGDLFLNMARRSQSLIDRQLELIDELERNETDSGALEELFRLDHLATRMRRNAEDLIVLSGAEPARRWSEPVVFTDAVRAAIAEVEDYTRVELIPMDDVALVGSAVNDVVHLFAELVENATSFSPPGTKVLVSGQPVNGGQLIEIEDRGIGMGDAEMAEANERLANPTDGDFTLARQLGFFVVARLAQRHKIKVQLRTSWYGGVRALVLLPADLVVRLAEHEAPVSSRDRAALLPPPPAPVGAARRGGEKLPIFEAARSDWFDRDQGDFQPPIQRRGGEGRRVPVGNGNGRGQGPSALAGDQSGRIPVPPGGFDQAPPIPNGTAGAGPRARNRSTGRLPRPRPDQSGPLPQRVPLPQREPLSQREPHRDADPTSPIVPDRSGPLPPVERNTTTSAGLPKRVPRANLAPGMASDDSPPVGDTSAGARTPDGVRSLLSRYRSGLERGRAVSASDDGEIVIDLTDERAGGQE